MLSSANIHAPTSKHQVTGTDNNIGMQTLWQVIEVTPLEEHLRSHRASNMVSSKFLPHTNLKLETLANESEPRLKAYPLLTELTQMSLIMWSISRA